MYVRDLSGIGIRSLEWMRADNEGRHKAITEELAPICNALKLLRENLTVEELEERQSALAEELDSIAETIKAIKAEIAFREGKPKRRRRRKAWQAGAGAAAELPEKLTVTPTPKGEEAKA